MNNLTDKELGEQLRNAWNEVAEPTTARDWSLVARKASKQYAVRVRRRKNWRTVGTSLAVCAVALWTWNSISKTVKPRDPGRVAVVPAESQHVESQQYTTDPSPLIALERQAQLHERVAAALVAEARLRKLQADLAQQDLARAESVSSLDAPELDAALDAAVAAAWLWQHAEQLAANSAPDGQQAALQAYRQLTRSYPQTAAGRRALEHLEKLGVDL